MYNIMDTFTNAINEKRNIKPNSLKAYLISIKKLNEFITKKNFLAAVVVSLDAMNNENKYTELLADYRTLLDDINSKFAEDYDNGEKSKKQKENWTTIKELVKVMNSYLADIKERELLKQETLNKKQMALLQKWVIANLFLNKENPPTRLDYAPMEIINKADFEKLEAQEN